MSLLNLLVIGSFFTSAAYAGNENGNGGDGIYCRTSSSIELLDYYEARVLRGVVPNLGGANLSTVEKVKLAINRLEKFDSQRAEAYRSKLTTFFAETKFLSGIMLTDVPDSLHLVLPNGCEIHQVAIQKEPEFAGDPVYVVNEDLWRLMSSDNQAGVILHEIIYREAISRGHLNSIKTRYYNSIISSNLLGEPSFRNYAELMRRVNLPFSFRWYDLTGNRKLEFSIGLGDQYCSKGFSGNPNWNDLRTAYQNGFGLELYKVGIVNDMATDRDIRVPMYSVYGSSFASMSKTELKGFSEPGPNLGSFCLSQHY